MNPRLPGLKESLARALARLEAHQRTNPGKELTISDANGELLWRILDNALSRPQLHYPSGHTRIIQGAFALEVNPDTVTQKIYLPPDASRPFFDMQAICNNAYAILDEMTKGWTLSRGKDGALYFTNTLPTDTALHLQDALEGITGVLPEGHIVQVTRYPGGIVTWEAQLREEKRLLLSGAARTAFSAAGQETQRERQSRIRDQKAQAEIQAGRIRNNYPPYLSGEQVKAHPLPRLEAIDLELERGPLQTAYGEVCHRQVTPPPNVGVSYMVIPATEPVIERLLAWGMDLPGVTSAMPLTLRAGHRAAGGLGR